MTTWLTDRIKSINKVQNHIGIIVCLHLGLITALLSGCGVAPPQRAFTVQELMIDGDKLPKDWAMQSIRDRPIIHFGQDEAVEMAFYYIPNAKMSVGVVTIYQHSAEKRAGQTYVRIERGPFNENSHWSTTPVFIPESFTFVSTTADQSRFGCRGRTSEGLFEDKTVCTYLAQYEEFVVYLTIDMDKNDQVIITGEELQDLVSAIDEQFAKYLSFD